MADIGIIVGVSVGAGYRHGKQVILVDCMIDDPADVQTIEYLFPSGVQSVPQVGESVLIHDVSSEYRVASSTNTGVIVVSEAGESAIFAVDGSTVKGSVKALKNGEIVVNDGTGYGTEWGVLNSEWAKLITWVSSISTAVIGLRGAVVVPAPLPSVTGAKVAKLRV